MGYLQSGKYYEIETKDGRFSGHVVRASLWQEQAHYVVRTADGVEVPVSGEDILDSREGVEEAMEWGMVSDAPGLEILPSD